jgi:CHAT domain-containing protein/Flp pilus assembly protein TadD
MSDRQKGQPAAETRAAEILLGGALPPPTSSGPCLSEEALAAFVDGRGTAAERAAAAQHIESCEICAAVVGAVAEGAREFDRIAVPALPGMTSRRSFGEWVAQHRGASISALAAAAVLVLAVWVGLPWFSPERRLDRALGRMDGALGEFRPIEPRLTGAAYRPAQPVTRAAAPTAELPLEVRDSANDVERVARAMVPEARARAMAKVYVLRGEPDRAVSVVAGLVTRSTDARFLSDAAAAYLSRGRDGDAAQALEAAARAVDLNPRLAEAWFNLALAHAALGQFPAAAKAWDRVIELEPGSGWAGEATRRRANVPKRESWRSQDEAEFRAAVERRDDVAAARVGERSLADARAFFERVLLADVAVRWSGGNHAALIAAATRADTGAQALGRLSEDRWPVDVVAQVRALVDHGDAGATRTACIPALLDIVRLRSTDKWSDAAVRMNEMSACRAPVPEALVLHTSFVRLRNAASAVPPPVALPRQLAELADMAGKRGYFGLQGRALRTEAVLLARQAQYVQALDRSVAAEAAAHRGQDLDGEITNAALIGELNDYVGAQETGWRERSRALSRIYAVDSPQRRFNMYHDAIRALVDGSLYTAALRFLDIALADLSSQPDFSLVLLADRAALLSRVGRRDEANADVRAALSLVPQSGTSADRAGFRRTALKSQAIVALRDDPALAVRALTDLIETGDPRSRAFEFAELLFLRAGAFAGQSELGRADEDFKHGFDLVDERQLNLPDHLRPAAFDRTWDAAAAAIRLHAITRGDPWSALPIAERARASALATAVGASRLFQSADVFRRQLPSDLGVVFVSALDDRLLSWGMARDVEPSFSQVAIPYEQLADLTRRFRDANQPGAREQITPLAHRIYEIVLAEHAAMLARTSTLVVIPDGPLLATPFAALVGPSGKFLIEERAVIIAPSLRLFITLSSRLRNQPEVRSVLAVGNPAQGPGLPWRLPRLNGAEHEAETVAAIYGGMSLIRDLATKPAFLDALPRADVVHFAGHALINTARSEASSLVLAPSSGDLGLLSPNEIDRTHLASGALVVLAACDTAEGAVFRGEGLMGLVRPFLAAGAASVVANLWPLEDDRAAEFSVKFHQQIRAGASPARALQSVQADFASRKLPATSWAGWMLIGGYN